MSYVYVVGSEIPDVFKIGWTLDYVKKRLRDLQIGSPVKLHIEHVIRCDRMDYAKDLEKELHRQFAAQRLHGEWFRLSPNDLRVIRESFPIALQWSALVWIEPRLADLLSRAKHLRRKGPYCANHVWFGTTEEKGFREELDKLVGWLAGALRNQEAYDLAYYTIYDALPNCRHNGRICA